MTAVSGALEVVRAVNGDRRLIFFGDIHGCYDELMMLLHRIAPAGDDVVVSVGDLIRKGPQPARCLDLWRDRRYLAVLGNHELKILAQAEQAAATHFVLKNADRSIVRRRDLVAYLRSWPVVIDFPGEDVAAVHGGLFPDMKLRPKPVERNREALIKMRYVRRDNGSWAMVPKGKEQRGDVPWWEVWDGDRTIVYGHTPRPKPHFEGKTIGLDTGCVYGGRLSAAIFENGQWSTVSVKARRTYARPEAALVQVVKRFRRR
jgi:hypothetical protein